MPPPSSVLLAVTFLFLWSSQASAQGALPPDSLTSLNRELLRAIGRGREEDVRRLVATGAPLSGDAVIAAVNQGPEMGRLILELGGDPNGAGELFGMSPLAFLAVSGEAAQIGLLLEFGADPNPQPGPGVVPPLLMAAMNNNVEVARVLLEAGANPNVETPGGDSALEWAAAVGLLTGDSRMAEMMGDGSPEAEELLRRMEGGLAVDGTYQEGFQSLNRDQKTYPAGGFTGPCLSRRNPAFDPPHPNPGATGSGSYRETHVSFVGGMKVGMITPPGCEPLHLAPAEYEVTVLGGDVNWVWVCSEGSGADCKIVTRDDTFLSAVERFEVGVEPSTEEGTGSPDDHCRVESVSITAPNRGTQYAFDDSPTGILELTASAQTQPSTCDQPLRWSIEDIGSTSAQVESGGDSATFTYRRLPGSNEDFGPKVVTVEVGGRTDTLSVEVFFSPTAFNHPGSEGTPNWFFYWSQTLAGRGETFKHTPQRVSETVEGELVQGQYDYSEDMVYLTDRAFSKSCAPRTPEYGGGESKGIDCFAELVRHESQHKRDRQAWWGAFDPKAARDESLSDYLLNHDADGDYVPNGVERGLAASRGCDWMWRSSCSGRPEGKIDVEMNAYNVGWGWIRGGADKEDWSWCGKQWSEARACPGSKIW